MRSKITIGSRGKFHYFIEGKEVSEAEYRKVFPKRTGPVVPPNTMLETSASWPIKSTACAVDATQKAEAEASSVKHGCPTEYVLDGKGSAKPILRNNAHRNRFLKMMGYHDRDGGYGQAAG